MATRITTDFPSLHDVEDSRFKQNLVAQRAALRVTYIPKNMCSTLKLSILLSEGRIGPHQLKWFQDNHALLHLWADQLVARNPLELQGLESVAVIRHPASRLTSGLVDKLFYAEDEGFGWIVKPLLARFVPMAAREVDEMEVQHFLDALCFFSDGLADSHFRSQVALLSGRYDHLLAMENTEAVSAFFADRDIPLHTADRHAINRGRLGDEPIHVGLETQIQRVRAATWAVKARTDKFPVIILEPELRAQIEDVASRRFSLDQRLWEQAMKSEVQA